MKALISVQELQNLIFEKIQSKAKPLEAENVALTQAIGRVLNQDIVSQINIPNADISAMDGYALPKAAKQGETFAVIGESVAGEPYCGEIAPNECIRIMTGAHIPKACSTVVIQENVTRIESQEGKPTQIQINQDISDKANIRYLGEVVSEGQVVLKRGKRLQVGDIALLASIGLVSVPVLRKVRVAVISTGNELQEPGTTISNNRMIFDSNRHMIMAKLIQQGFEVVDGGQAKDSLDEVVDLLRKVAAAVDVVITSGGASVGDYDYIREAVTEIGTIHHYKVAMKPGKPFVFGEIQGAWYFGLPGNPVSGFAGFDIFINPALWLMNGVKPMPLQLSLKATLKSPLKKSTGRADYQRAILYKNADDSWMVDVGNQQGSHNLLGLSEANAYVLLDASDQSKQSGDVVTVLPFVDAFL